MVTFAAANVITMSLAVAGQISGGEEAFDNLWLMVPFAGVILTGTVAGVLAAIAAALAIVRRGERSVLVFLPLVVLVFFAIMLVGELLVGHE